jgi:hypothetical protein
MWEFVRGKWVYFRGSFRGSETIIWARLQMALGAAWLALSQTDMSVFISDKKQLAYWFMGNAFITEMLRRHREDWHDDGDQK